MRRASVLMLVENLSVPRDRRVWQEALTLTDAGYRVDVVCPLGEEVDTQRLERRDGVTIHRFSLARTSVGLGGYAREYVRAAWEVSRLALRLDRERRFDVVHAANPPDFLLLAVLPLKRRGARFVFDHHDLAPELYLSRFETPREVVHFALRAMERTSFALADVVIATNESYRTIATSRGRKALASVFVVRNAPPRSFLEPGTLRPELKCGRRHLIAYVGTMAPQDGVDHALRALARLRLVRADWHAVFAGDGDALIGLRKLTHELGLADRVTFLGLLTRQAVRDVLETADVCLAPEPSSPFNEASTMIKVLEYMAAGRALVSYDLRESRVSAGEAAAYARPGDEASFAAHIAELLDDAARRARMGAVGRARVRGELSWAESQHQLLRAYAHLLDGGRLRSAAA